ncbi:hypothetical protein ABWH96_05250 [Marivirga tractuosa]|uniref:hypothetical protein n=1 Tax=Marivirga tractuosa TaxID=1006 RepID=UPI0035D0F8FE
MAVKLSKTITLCQEGDRFASNGTYKEALKSYISSWNSIPDEKLKDPLAKVILIQIYASYEKLGQIEEGIRSLQRAKTALHGDTDSRINFLLGKYFLDTEHNQAEAYSYFKIAWDASEGRAFLKEDTNYTSFLLRYSPK